MLFHAAIIAVAIVVALRLGGFPAFWLSLLVWFPIPLSWSPDSLGWTIHVWAPCAIAFAFLQTMSAVEAVFRFGERYRVVVALSATVGFFATAAGLYCWLTMPELMGIIGHVTDFVAYQRIFTFAFLVLSVGLFSTFLNPSEFWTRREGRHIVMLTLLVLTWAIPAVVSRGGYYWWVGATQWVVWIRSGVLVGWVAVNSAPVLSRWYHCISGREDVVASQRP